MGRARIVSLILAVALAVAVMVPVSAQSVAPVKIVFIRGFSGDMLQLAIDMYKKQFPNRPVELTLLPYDDMHGKVLAELTGRTGSIDAVPIEAPVQLSETYSFLEPLEPYISRESVNLDEYLPPGLPSSRYPYPKGQLYTLPFRQGVDITHYRADLFEKAGLPAPTTIEALTAAADKLKRPGFYPVTAMLQQGPYLINQWLTILWGFGGDVLDDNLKSVKLGKPAVDATQWLIDLIYKNKVLPQASLNYVIEDTFGALAKGNAAIAIISSANITPLDTTVVAQGGRMGYAPPPHLRSVPVGHGVFWAWTFGIPRDSRNKEAAWELIKYISSYEPQLQAAIKLGNGPVLASVFNSQAYKNSTPASAAMLEAFKYAKPKPPHPEWAKIEDALASELSAALAGKKTAEAAMDDAAKKIGEIIK
jgi:multiple sugar transport system substrate-binding protein